MTNQIRLSAVALLFTPSLVFAWGYDGHRIHAYIHPDAGSPKTLGTAR